MSAFDRKVARRKPPIRFDRLAAGLLQPGHGHSPVRLSTALRLLREQGNEAGATELEQDARTVASWCPQCERKLVDPVIGLTTYRGERCVAFACPHCSGPEVLAKWEAEGQTNG